MQDTKLAQGECSHPPFHDDVSDEYLSDFYDSDIDYDYYDMHSYHDSPIFPKWPEKTIQATGDLVGDPLDSRKCWKGIEVHKVLYQHQEKGC